MVSTTVAEWGLEPSHPHMPLLPPSSNPVPCPLPYFLLSPAQGGCHEIWILRQANVLVGSFWAPYMCY